MVYLAYGVIRGPFHRALPISTFQGYGLGRIARFTDTYGSTYAQKVTAVEVHKALVLGEKYGLHFTVPMALALICIHRRRQVLFEPASEELKMILDNFTGRGIPHDWVNDSTIMHDIVFATEQTSVSSST
jgi:hypothetical protein